MAASSVFGRLAGRLSCFKKFPPGCSNGSALRVCLPSLKESLSNRWFSSDLIQKYAAPKQFLNTSVVPSKLNLLPPTSVTVHSKRPRTYISNRKLTAKNVDAVTDRFYRMPYGVWIRTRTGRHKKVFKKQGKLHRDLLQHVFCSRSQSILLDRMTGSFFKRRRHIPDDPYEPYHHRTNMEAYWYKPRPFYP